jgi:hypothetical protein
MRLVPLHRGDPGIGFDYEYGIRLWKKKFEVGLTIMQFRYHQVGLYKLNPVAP